MKRRYPSVVRILSITGLSIMLLFSQLIGMHAHIDHDGQTNSNPVHVIDFHGNSWHEIDMEDHHIDGTHFGETHHDEHHHEIVDISADYFAQKTKISNSLLVIAFLIGFVLLLPRSSGRYNLFLYQAVFTTRYHLLRPPLRAPPAH